MSLLVVHWTPVSKTKSVLKNGITKSGNGLYCFPLTGHKAVDRWWVSFFNSSSARQRKKYNDIVFRIKEEDLPAYFGYWTSATTRDDFKKEIKTLKELGARFRETILWRFGEYLACKNNVDCLNCKDHTALYLGLAEKEIDKSRDYLIEQMNDPAFMTFTFEDYQIVLSKSIPANRIIRVMSREHESGRVKRIERRRPCLRRWE